MKDSQIDAQYTTGLSRHHIEQALIAAAGTSTTFQPADPGPLEDFQTMGRIATSQLADLAKITSADSHPDPLCAAWPRYNLPGHGRPTVPGIGRVNPLPVASRELLNRPHTASIPSSHTEHCYAKRQRRTTSPVFGPAGPLVILIHRS